MDIRIRAYARRRALLFAIFNNVSTETDNIFALILANDCYCQEICVAPGAELVFTPSVEARERRQESEEIKNREGVAAGGATHIL